MQQILHQSEGTEPTAHEPSEQAPEQKEEAQRGKGDLEPLPIQQGLERPQGAGCHRAGTGIAVQPWYTGIFQAAAIYLPLQKSIHISVCDNCKNQLYRRPQFLHMSTLSQCIPCRSSLPFSKSPPNPPMPRQSQGTALRSTALPASRGVYSSSKRPSIFSFHDSLSIAPTTVSSTLPSPSRKKVVGTAVTSVNKASYTERFSNRCG